MSIKIVNIRIKVVDNEEYSYDIFTITLCTNYLHKLK